MKPITPKEVTKLKEKLFVPNYVFQAFNELIAKNWSGSGHSAIVLQKDAVKLIKEYGKVNEKYIFENGLLDIESIYEKAGWKVYYDKPGWCESYEASYTFSK